MWSRALALIAALAAASATSSVRAQQDYPNRVVRVVFGAPAGGATDQIVRPVAEHLSKALGQQFVLDPRPGAGGNIAAESVAKTAADGYALYVATIATNAIGPHLYRRLGYDAARDFVGVARLASFPNAIVVPNTFAARTLPELIAFAKANPGVLNHGSTGVGTSTHLAATLLAGRAGIGITHVPYRGTAPMTTALLSGEIQMAIDNLPGLLPQIRAGAIRAIAVTGPTRSPDLPDVPTVAETLPDFNVTSWYGLAAPARTPAAVIERLSSEIERALASEGVRARYRQVGAEPAYLGPKAFDAFMAGESARWKPIVEASGATLD